MKTKNGASINCGLDHYGWAEGGMSCSGGLVGSERTENAF